MKLGKPLSRQLLGRVGILLDQNLRAGRTKLPPLTMFHPLWWHLSTGDMQGKDK